MNPPEIRKLDFSEFHPLDHSVLRCNGFPGGRRRHLEYRWSYQWSESVKRWTLCVAHRHQWTTWHGRNGDTSVSCRNCFRDMKGQG